MGETTAPVVEIAFTSEFVEVLATGPAVAVELGASSYTVDVLKSVANIFAEAADNQVITELEAFKRDHHLVLWIDDTENTWRIADLVTNDTARDGLAFAAEELHDLASKDGDLVDALRCLSAAFVEDPETLVLRIVYAPPRPLKQE